MFQSYHGVCQIDDGSTTDVFQFLLFIPSLPEAFLILVLWMISFISFGVTGWEALMFSSILLIYRAYYHYCSLMIFVHIRMVNGSDYSVWYLQGCLFLKFSRLFRCLVLAVDFLEFYFPSHVSVLLKQCLESTSMTVAWYPYCLFHLWEREIEQ